MNRTALPRLFDYQRFTGIFKVTPIELLNSLDRKFGNYGGFSIFPLELWFMIFQYLREESPQHISRLAQTCKSFYQELNHVIYQPVRLRRVENARRFANTVSGRPALAALVKEVRHAEDMGFADFAGYSEPFYKALAKLPNLETLVMRKTLYPSAEYSPQAELQEVLTEISNVSEYRDVPESYLKDLMTDMADRGYPLGDASDPFGLGFHPCQEDFSLQGWAQDLAEHAYFSRDYLKDLIPALRTCHIGTDSDLNPDMYQPFIDFNETIFTLPHLQKLCITGATFRRFGLEEASIDNRASSLKELLLLNCEVTPHNLALIIRFPRALERLTIRVPLSDLLHTLPDLDDYLVFSDQLSMLHSESLQYVDLDIYGGTDYGVILHPFSILSEVIITFSSMFGHIDEWIILPESLQKLTFRHEEGILLQLSPLLDDIEDGNLPNLRSVTCQIPDNIREGTTSLGLRVEVATFKSKFKALGVELSTEVVPYPLTMPKYDVCPCENLAFYRQFPFHTRAKPRLEYEHAANTTAAISSPAPTQSNPALHSQSSDLSQ